MSRKSILIAITVLAISLGSVSCTKDFEQYYQVTKLRVLGIKAEKPTLKEGESTKIQAVVSLPETAHGAATYEWSWCPLRTQAKNWHECPIKREQIVAGLKKKYPNAPIEKFFPQLTLGNGKSDTVTFAYPGPQFGVKAMCQAIVNSADEAGKKYGFKIPTLDCDRDYEVTIRVVVKSGEQEVIAVKQIALWLGTDQVNHNPQLTGMQIRPAGVDYADLYRGKGATWIPKSGDLDALWYTVPDGAKTPLVANGKFEIRALLDQNSVETWNPPKKFGAEQAPPPEKEAIKFSWFVNRRDNVEAKNTGVLRDGKSTMDDVTNAIWTPSCGLNDENLQPPNCDPLKVWLFARDGRLGTDWLERNFTIVGSVPKEEDDD